MAKIGIINFHNANNYGSVLLAYAMSKILNDMGHDSKIINYQPQRQTEMYRIPMTTGRHWAKKTLEKICWLPFLADLKRKVSRYAAFRSEYLPLTTYNDAPAKINDICGRFDVTIAAGDQIWNTRCNDFEWVYYLDFVCSGKKIAYAPSMGGMTKERIRPDEYRHIKELVGSFDAVSVRDSNVNKILDERYPVTLDPTMLLSLGEWCILTGDNPLIKGKYVFYYDPFDLDDDIEHAKCFSEKNGCKLVTCNLYFIFKADRHKFEYHLDAGPQEFLNYIRFAEACVGRSFHLAVFSILFEKELFIAGGMNDKRIKELMSKMFKDVSLDLYSSGDDVNIKKTAYNEIFRSNLENEREYSLSFLKEVL